MGKTTTLSVRVDQSTKDQLEASAKRTQRSMSFLAAAAIEEYLAVQEFQKARTRDALMDWIDSWGADNELPKPKP